MATQKNRRLPGVTAFGIFSRRVLLLFCIGNVIPAYAAEGGAVAAAVAEGAPASTEHTRAILGAERPVTDLPTPEPLAAPAGKQTAAGDFTPQALYRHADPIGKSVILLLIFGSLLSWSVWLGKTWSIFVYSRRLKTCTRLLSDTPSLLDDSVKSLPARACNDIRALALAELPEQRRQAPSPEGYFNHIKERVHARILRLEAAEARRMTRGVSILATTTAVAPFIGLFGTVWGIMRSFISIAQMQSTNLSVVAPGIAESLFATALGLGVAIPAVIFYNMVARNISGCRQQLTDASTLTLCLLSEAFDRRDAVRQREA